MSDRKPARRATYQDVLDAPAHLIAEVLDGELVLSPIPSPACSSVTGQLLCELDGPKWRLLFRPELHLGEHVVVPDLAAWTRERLPYVTDADFLELAPDWVCEVLSDFTERDDRYRKLRIYAEQRIDHAWFLHPVRRTLEVMKRQGSHWLITSVHGEGELVQAAPFQAMAFEMSSLWVDFEPWPGPDASMAGSTRE